jgi:hypothetical protein
VLEIYCALFCCKFYNRMKWVVEFERDTSKDGLDGGRIGMESRYGANGCIVNIGREVGGGWGNANGMKSPLVAEDQSAIS